MTHSDASPKPTTHLLVVLLLLALFTLTAGTIAVLIRVFEEPASAPAPVLMEETHVAPKDPTKTTIAPAKPAAPEPASIQDEEWDHDEAPDEPGDVSTLRARLVQSLDKSQPLYAYGDSVELRRANGQVHRGVFLGINDDLALVVDGDIRERVPLEELDRASRIRTDPVYRERMIEARIEYLARPSSRPGTSP